MALTPVQEAQVLDLIAQQSALLSLAGVEATILSKLGATKVTLSDLPTASVIDDADLLLLRQGVTDKSVTGLTFKSLIPAAVDATDTVKGIVSLGVAANFPSTSDTEAATPAYLRSAYISKIKPFSAALSSNTLVNTLAPSIIEFRPTSLNSGSYNTVNTSSLSLTIPTAASIGLTTLVQGRLVLLVAYNAGAPVLCVANLEGGLLLDETNLISPTTISAGSTSKTVIYSDSAVSANSPYRVVGFVDVIWTSGTGFTTLTRFQGVGGQSVIPVAFNASGSAPLYACRAWVNFDGTGTVAIRASGNVSSITDNGTGDYTVNFTTAIQDVNYSVVALSRRSTSSNLASVNIFGSATSMQTTSVRIAAQDSGSTLSDNDVVCVSIFR